MIQYIDWMPNIENIEGAVGINNEIAIINYSELMGQLSKTNQSKTLHETLANPHKFDFFMIVHHSKGQVHFKVDMQDFKLTEANNLITLVPGNIISIESCSDDFDATIMITSKRFVENLLPYFKGSIQFRATKHSNIVDSLLEQEINLEEVFFKIARYVLANKENPFRMQVIQHIILAIFYSSEKSRAINEKEQPHSSADILSTEFIKLVQDNFRTERQLTFYADKLCITPRYLSRVLKDTTGLSAAEWIERYVVLEARALLKSTNMTIQQISDSLNFPSQTFFGKYFKRRVGLSPKEYRRNG